MSNQTVQTGTASRARTSQFWTSKASTVGLTAVALIATVFALLPIVIIVFTSFKTTAEVNSFPPTILPDQFTLSNFERIFTDLDFARLLTNSLIFAGGVTLFSLIFDSLAAYALARINFKGKQFLLIAIIASLMIPFQALLIPVYQLISDLGWINSYTGLIAPRAADAFGIFFLRQFFLALPRDIDSAARVDGASEFRIFWNVVLPNAVPALVTLGVYNFVNNWNDLLWPLVLATDSRMATLTSGLTALTGPGGIIPHGVMMAGSLIALIPLAILFLLLQKRFVASVATTGLK